LLGRDARATEGRLGAHLRSQTDLSFVAEDGLSLLLSDSPQRRVPERLIGHIAEWLRQRHPILPCRSTVPSPAAFGLDSAVFEGVRETPLRFGPDDGLFGILAQPEPPSPPSGQRARTAILMLNVGTNHRVGPNRLYVKMARHWARAGYHTLRFDLAGMGDSRSASGYTETRLYSKDSVIDVRAAIDALSARGCDRFVLLGLCSGAYAAFQTALADSRVVAQVLLNPRRLSVAAGDTLEQVMSESYKSRRYYQKALFSPQTYLRLFRGQVNIRGIGRRMQALIGARLARLSARLLGRASDEDVLTNVRQLCRRGVESLFVVAHEDDGVDYLEFHLGTSGRAVRSPRFRMHFVNGSDHTFSRIASQDELIAYVSTELTKRLPGCPTPTRAGSEHARSAR
jgi:pimeloyl-ACP methyl ester carboxylesterase